MKFSFDFKLHKLFEYILLINGLRFLKSSKNVTRKLSYIFQIIAILFNTWRLSFFIRSVKLTRSKFFTVHAALFYIALVILNLWVYFKTSIVSDYIRRIIELISVTKRIYLIKKSSRFMPFVWLILFLANLAEKINLWYKVGNVSYFNTWLSDVHFVNETNIPVIASNCLLTVIYSTYSSTWYSLMVLAYLFVLLMLQRMSLSILSSFEDRTKFSSRDLIQLRLIWRQVKSLRYEFDVIFSLLPFLWSVYMFAYCTSLAFRLQFGAYGAKTSIKLTIIAFLLLSIRCLPILTVIFINRYYNLLLTNSVSAFTTRLITSCQDKAARSDRESLIKELENNIDLELTAWKLFSFDRSFILGFLSSIVSFAVLFLQLVER